MASKLMSLRVGVILFGTRFSWTRSCLKIEILHLHSLALALEIDIGFREDFDLEVDHYLVVDLVLK
jgi:hypothetical protein